MTDKKARASVDELLDKATPRAPLKKKILAATKKQPQTSLLELGRLIHAPIADIEQAIFDLKHEGYELRIAEETIERDLLPPPAMAKSHFWRIRKSKPLKIGIVTDTHLGSIHARLDALNTAYDHFVAEGITRVYHGGNFIDGYKVGINEFELVEEAGPSIERQINYAARVYPKRLKIKTYFISGCCHEGWWIKKSGLNIGRLMASRFKERGRDDIEYLGHLEADIELRTSNLPKNQRGPIMRIFHPGGGSAYALCFDEQTEILTREKGFVRFAELDGSENVATLNRERLEWEWQRPADYTDEYYEGPMIHFSGKRHDFLVTPNHRMFVRRPWLKKANPWCFVEASEVKLRSWEIYRGSEWSGTRPENIALPRVLPEPGGKLKYDKESLPAAQFMAFLGWFVSEGNLNRPNGQIELNQSESSIYYDEIIELCRSLGYRPYAYGGKIRVTSKQLYELLLPLGKSHQKYVPEEYKQLAPELLEEFIFAYWKGDGHFHPDGELHSACTASKKLADDLVEILMKCGYAATYSARQVETNEIAGNIVKSTRIIYQLSVSRNVNPTMEPYKKYRSNSDPNIVDYAGRIYCVTVPNSVVLVKRNGKIAWSGNSYKAQKISESLQGGEKPQIQVITHFHKFDYNYAREIHNVLGGCLQDQTTFMRKKHIEAHVGYLIFEIKIAADGVVESFKPEWKPFYDQGFYKDYEPR